MTAPHISQFEPVDPAPAGQLILSMTASDADRERAIGVLSEAFPEGRLTTEEHSARVEHVYGAPAHTVPHRVAACALGAQIRPRRRLLLPGPGSGWRAVRRGVVMRVPARDRDESDGPVTASATAGTAAGRSLPGRPAGRRPEFDVMRAFVVAGLVVFHSAVVFAAGVSWFVTDPQPSAGFTVFLLWGSLWGMPLLLLISGMGAQYAMRTRPVAAFARERLARLGIPFAAGLTVLVPPMFYLERLAQPAFHQSYWQF